MKRHPTLHDLSRHHHHGLVWARRLKNAKAKDAIVGAQQFLDFWRSELTRHLREEEEGLLPFYARRVAADDEDIVQTLTDHVAIRRTVWDMAARVSSGEGLKDLLNELGKLLEAHIRFEERVLFPKVEAALTTEEMAALEAALKRSSSNLRRQVSGRGWCGFNRPRCPSSSA